MEKREPGGRTVKNFQRLACAALALSAMRAGAQGSIAGTVYDSLSTHAPLANATVVLVERSQYATTDAKGRFRIDSVPDGHYTLGFMHPVLDALDLEAPVVTVDVSGGRRAAVTLFTPSSGAAYARICPGGRELESGVLIGRVRDVDDQSSLAGATVSTEWAEFTLEAGRPARHRMRAEAQTNANGVYRLCSVPTKVPLEVHTELAGFLAGPTPLLLDTHLISRLDFAISRKDSAARTLSLGDSSQMPTGKPGTASLRGTVVGGDNRGMRNAEVSVLGTPRSVRTDGFGVFHLDHIPAGTRTIQVKSIGLMPMTLSMDFATSAVRDTTLSIAHQAQALDAVSVKEHSSNSLMADNGFDARRAKGLGAYVTEEDLAKHNYADLTSVLMSVRGLHVEYGSSGFPVAYLRGINDFGPDGKSLRVYCIPNIFIDGAPYAIDRAPMSRNPDPKVPSPYSELTGEVRPEMIRGIEVYSSSGTIPAQYDRTSSTGCGSIVIWLKER
jgi:hypothetical protein